MVSRSPFSCTLEWVKFTPRSIEAYDCKSFERRCNKDFDKEGPIASDTGVIAEPNNGLVVVTHLVDTSSIIQTNLMEKNSY